MGERDARTVDVGLGPVQTELPFDRNVLGGKGFVHLDEFHVAQGERGTFEGAADGRRRANAHHVRVNARRVPRDDFSQGLDVAAKLGQAFLRREDERRRTVTNATRISSGGHTVLGEHGLELAERFEGRLRPRMFVHVDELVFGATLASLHGHTNRLGVVDTGVGRLLPPLLRQQGQLVHVLASNLVLLSEVFRGDTHGRLNVRVGQGSPQGVLHLHGGPKATILLKTHVV
mmetsp:Transcript_346/g.1061  ORF Transcript_346/g.1061 Transcript_346/m.1061 type:complete len:231 (+) Transcript_346:178-870(+)